MTDIREEFEAWQVETGRTDPIWFGAASFDDRKREYVLDQINRDWIVWQASRSALRVELPMLMKQSSSETYTDGVRAGWNACRDELQENLQQAGIEVKHG